jgi:hypothetical protein
MKHYKNIPVDPETHQRFLEICRTYDRKQGAQFRAMVNSEWMKLAKMKSLSIVDVDSNLEIIAEQINPKQDERH